MPTFIHKEGPDKIAAQTIGGVGVVVEDLKRITIKAVEAILGAEPHEAHLILHTAQHRIVRQPVFYLVMREVIRLAMCIANPYKQT